MGKDLKGKEIGKGFLQRKDGRYEGRFTCNGKRYTLYGYNLRSLKEDVKNKRKDLESNILNNLDSITLNEWFDLWINEYKEDKVKDSTLCGYISKFTKHIKHNIGNMMLKDIKTIHIQRLYNELIDNGMSPNTLHETVNCSLSNLFKIAQDNDFIIKNPCKGVIMPNRNYDEPRVLSIVEQKLFLRAINNKYYEPLFLLALTTGLRIGELTGLKWSDIDFKNKELTVNRTLHYYKDRNSDKCRFVFQSPKSKSSRRTIPLIDDIIDALKKHKETQEKNLIKKGCNYVEYGSEFENMVFYTKNNTPIKRELVRISLRIITKKMNQIEADLAEKEQREPIIIEKITPHTLRHTFTTRAFEMGLQPKTVQVILGHSNLNITMDLYTHIMKETKTKEIDKLSDMLKMV